MTKYVYSFAEGKGVSKNTLGGKGAGLAEMLAVGMPVPDGFTVTTEACVRYYKDKKVIAPEVIDEIFAQLAALEAKSGKKFGDPKNPLLVSVRSGARVSMPGMMDTILNLGLNDEVVVGLAQLTGNERFAYDSYRRFVQMFSDVVMEVSKTEFEREIDEMKEHLGVKLDTDLSAENLKELVLKFKAKFKRIKGMDFPADPKVQLIEAIKAVFRSWDNPRANYYRKMNDIPYEWGTAVNIQMMVFGNMGERSGTGVAFSRNPSNGENKLYGEFLMNAQGEDVVAGIRTPMTIDKLKEINEDVYNEFHATSLRLEKHYKNMQDMEFTIEEGKLYMLQTRNGKRTAAAALQIACDMIDEGLVSETEALLQIDPKQLDALLHPTFDPKALKAAKPVGSGLPASPGAASGKIVFTAEEAVEWVNEGKKVVLVRLETSPEDIEGMHVSQGILTVRGGMTSHAAVVARGMGTCCVAGCGDIKMHEEEGFFELGGKVFRRGDDLSFDGNTGLIYAGIIPSVPASITGNFERIMTLSDKYKRLGVRANADTPKDAKQAYVFGAQGIGLCRTEHMFFETDRIKAMREMIVSENEQQRRTALAKLLPMQRSDFESLFEEMRGYPVTIRYLDPPLHEFLPTAEDDIIEIAGQLKVTVERLKEVIESLHEFNPMMGHRGCRLAVSYPEIAEMQTQAVIEAAIKVAKNHPEWNLVPEIMIPLVGEKKELDYVKDIVVSVADRLIKEAGVDLHYKVGTMIEIPRAAVLADELAQSAEFFSFGTNDLTQMTFGFSRDDATKFLNHYYDKKIFANDPFARVDQQGVGKLIEMAVKLGKQGRPDIKTGVCGEHGGEPSSVEFFHRVGLSYVSCSPYRVPIARLAAAQAAIKFGK